MSSTTTGAVFFGAAEDELLDEADIMAAEGSTIIYSLARFSS